MEATLLQCGLYRDRVLRSDRTHSQQAHASPIQKISKPAWHAPIVLQLRLERARHAAILHYQLVRKKYSSIRRLLQLCPVILHWPLDVVTQSAGRQQRPIRLAQELTRQDYHVRLPGTDDLVSLRRVRNHSHRAS